MLPQLAACLLAFAVTTTLIPWVMRVAREHRLLDYPDGGRRVHTEAVPRLGGVAIFIAAAVATVFVLAWDRFDGSIDLPMTPILPGFAIGCAIVFAIGIIDDLRGVSPLVKLAAQTAAALVVVAYGFRVDLVTVAGAAIYTLGPLSIPVTILWMVASPTPSTSSTAPTGSRARSPSSASRCASSWTSSSTTPACS